MSVAPGWRRFFRPTRDDEGVQRDVDEEIAFHLAMREESLRRRAGCQTYQSGVSPRYFATMGIPIRFGRDFSLTDDTTGVAVAVVDESMASNTGTERKRSANALVSPATQPGSRSSASSGRSTMTMQRDACRFAVVAVLLAAVGIYGVMSLSVANRSRELGVRLAVGAEPATLIGLVLREAALFAAIGVGLGVVDALAATRWMASLLYDVSPTDPCSRRSRCCWPQSPSARATCRRDERRGVIRSSRCARIERV